jgi:hypothetical protein
VGCTSRQFLPLFTPEDSSFSAQVEKEGASLRHVSEFKGHPKYLAPSLNLVSCKNSGKLVVNRW